MWKALRGIILLVSILSLRAAAESDVLPQCPANEPKKTSNVSAIFIIDLTVPQQEIDVVLYLIRSFICNLRDGVPIRLIEVSRKEKRVSDWMDALTVRNRLVERKAENETRIPLCKRLDALTSKELALPSSSNPGSLYIYTHASDSDVDNDPECNFLAASRRIHNQANKTFVPYFKVLQMGSKLKTPFSIAVLDNLTDIPWKDPNALSVTLTGSRIAGFPRFWAQSQIHAKKILQKVFGEKANIKKRLDSDVPQDVSNDTLSTVTFLPTFTVVTNGIIPKPTGEPLHFNKKILPPGKDPLEKVMPVIWSRSMKKAFSYFSANTDLSDIDKNYPENTTFVHQTLNGEPSDADLSHPQEESWFSNAGYKYLIILLAIMILLLIVCFVGVGFYRMWYKREATEPAPPPALVSVKPVPQQDAAAPDEKQKLLDPYSPVTYGEEAAKEAPNVINVAPASSAEHVAAPPANAGLFKVRSASG